MRFVSLIAFLVLAACAAPDGRSVGTGIAPDQPPEIWEFDQYAAALQAASCPESVVFSSAEALSLRVADVDPGPDSIRADVIEGMQLSGVWHITSSNSGFGGLSGLDVLPSGSLIAVTDDGQFVWIGIDAETGAPDGIGAIAEMLDPKGKAYPRKRLADAEDLAFRDGLAFVSFEQDHRISAFDLESCGAAAREALVVDLGSMVDGALLDANRGPEALAFSGANLVVGFEAHNRGGSPIGEVMTDGDLTNLRRTEQPNFFLMTGMDRRAGVAATVFRAYDPARGARAIINVESELGEIARATFSDPLPVDNFEAIAIGNAPDGASRIWVLSDDNFNDQQRTLLLALDLDQEP